MFQTILNFFKKKKTVVPRLDVVDIELREPPYRGTAPSPSSTTSSEDFYNSTPSSVNRD